MTPARTEDFKGLVISAAAGWHEGPSEASTVLVSLPSFRLPGGCTCSRHTWLEMSVMSGHATVQAKPLGPFPPSEN